MITAAFDLDLFNRERHNYIQFLYKKQEKNDQNTWEIEETARLNLYSFFDLSRYPNRILLKDCRDIKAESRADIMNGF